MPFARHVAGGTFLNVILGLIFCLVLTEVLLRVPSFLGADPSMPERDPGRMHVLCVGDSFTEGGSVAPGDRYPAQLQEFLEASAPESWATVNLGFTGETSAYISRRLPADLIRYRPEVVILWAGGNMDTRMLGPRSDQWAPWRFLEQALGRLELFRFVRVWLDDRAVDRRGRELAAASEVSLPTHEDLAQRFNQAQARERAFEVTTTEDERQALLEHDYRSMIEDVQSAGARPILVTYPVDLNDHGRANTTMRKLASEYGIPLVSSWEAAQRVPLERRKWHWGMHPSQPIYAELVQDLGPLVLGEVAPPDPTTQNPTQ